MSKEINQNELADFLEKILKDSIKFFKDRDLKKLKISLKSDNSQVTQIDIKVDSYLKAELRRFDKNISILSEESGSSNRKSNLLWMIDPIDGTKEFINGSKEFTVNIALIENKKPIFGAIFQPMTNTLYLGGNKFKPEKIKDEKRSSLISDKKESLPNVILSKSHSNFEEEAFCQEVISIYDNSKIIRMGSSLKFCKLCDGSAAFYPRFGDINSWDIAAGHAILNASGGDILDTNFKTLSYSNKKKQIIKGFVAFSKKEHLSFLKKILL